jgi:TPR repeat protein
MLVSGSPEESAAQVRLDTLHFYPELEEARAACNSGDMGECTHLGWIYEFGSLRDGQRVQANWRMAAELYRRACDSGNLGGCAQLAGAYYRGVGVRRNPTRAFELLEQTCSRGGRVACNRLSVMCSGGVPSTYPPDTVACNRVGALCTAGNSVACEQMRNVFPALRPKPAGTDTLDR